MTLKSKNENYEDSKQSQSLKMKAGIGMIKHTSSEEKTIELMKSIVGVNEFKLNMQKKKTSGDFENPYVHRRTEFKT